jgi:hypothetical protein
MYAVCTLKNSNSVCRANFTASNDIIGSEKNSSSKCLPHGAWKTEYVVILNVSKEDNGTDVTCAADCADFHDQELTDSKTIQLPCKLIPINQYNFFFLIDHFYTLISKKIILILNIFFTCNC